MLDRARWEPVLQVVRERLLTPVGPAVAGAGASRLQASYYGDLRARDAAYHQGTVWGWLIGPFVDAWLKVHPEDRAGARQLLEGFRQHLDEACVGSISEIFDAEPPYTPRGCVAQAWSARSAGDSRFEEQFAEHRPAGLIPARVSLEHTHIYRVLGGDGEWLARVAGRLRHSRGASRGFSGGRRLGGGRAGGTGERGTIRAVLPRFSRFSRRAAGDVTEEQVVAANIDTVFLVVGLDQLQPRRLERYLVVAWESGASPVIVLNKADLAVDVRACPTKKSAIARCSRPCGIRADSPRRSTCSGAPAVGRTGALARIVRGWQIDDREPADRSRPAADARRA